MWRPEVLQIMVDNRESIWYKNRYLKFQDFFDRQKKVGRKKSGGCGGLSVTGSTYLKARHHVVFDCLFCQRFTFSNTKQRALLVSSVNYTGNNLFTLLTSSNLQSCLNDDMMIILMITMVVTLEPCAMCAGAARNARLQRLVFGTDNKDYGAAGSMFDVVRDGRLPHKMEVISGVRELECKQQLDDFFILKR